MAEHWFRKVGEVEQGPFTPQQLRGLARTKQLAPTDLVRRHDSKWVPAEKVKGLFPIEAANPPTTASSAEMTADYSASSSGMGAGSMAPSVTGGASGGVAGGVAGVAASAPAVKTPGSAGSSSEQDHGLTAGDTLGNYLILELLGEGGMGVVLKAQHKRMERMVALKVLRRQATQSPGAIKRFHQEVRAAARLSHPNIVTAYDADEVNGVHFLVMEYVNGINLADLLQQRGKLEVAEAVDYVLQTAKGLAYAHGEGVVHRDIKPGNLLLDKRGTVKILDMGLASIREPQDANPASREHEVTQANQLLGTFDYMPPEQALDPRGVDHRADIYSLGCTLFRLVTGQLPFRGDNPLMKIVAHREQPAPSMRELRSDVSFELDRVYKKMLAKKPDDRQPTMAEVIRDLEKAMSGHNGFAPVSGRSAKASSGDLWGDGELRLEPSGGGLRDSSESIRIPAGPVADPEDDDDDAFQLAPAVGGGEERWFWQCMGQEVGPFTLKQLRSKKLSPDDQVRRENARRWIRADEVPGLLAR